VPLTKVVLFQETDGSVPTLEWLDRLPVKVRAKCLLRLDRLRQLGHELRRPEADYLRDDVWEPRVGFSGQTYRMLYLFDGRQAVIVSHGLVKERVVPPAEIDLAIERRQRFMTHPERHMCVQGDE
jgi:phage-related protein